MGLNEDIRTEAAAFKALAGEFKKRAKAADGKTRIEVGESDDERRKILAVLQALNEYLTYKMPEAARK